MGYPARKRRPRSIDLQNKYINQNKILNIYSLLQIYFALLNSLWICSGKRSSK